MSTNSRHSHTSHKLAPEVRWVVEKRGLLLVKGSQMHLKVDYPKAAVWDLISRGYRMPALIRMLSHIASLDESAAESLLFETMNEWLAAGFLILEENDG